jgi:serine/threonine-protein kinase RsbW
MLAEGFTNAVRHAHQGQPENIPIDIDVTVTVDSVELRIWDSGHEFDLQAMLDAMPAEVDPNAEGGRGLRLMQRMSDALAYTRTPDNRNCLLVVKHYVSDVELAQKKENDAYS